MFSVGEDVEADALFKRGWTVSAIARHLGRDRKTIRSYLSGERTPGVRRSELPDPLEEYRAYLVARFADDPHLWASALFDEVVALGYPSSYVSFARQIRLAGLRPHCEACSGVKGRETIEIDHPSGEEIQWDWFERRKAPWGATAYGLLGTLSHSGKTRGVLAESMDQPHLVEAMDGVMRRLGGTARKWRTDRLATVIVPGTADVQASFAPVAKHYGAIVTPCPPRRGNRKGAVECGVKFCCGRWWRTMTATTMAEAQVSMDHFWSTTGDARLRPPGRYLDPEELTGEEGRPRWPTVGELADAEELMALPAVPYPATIEVHEDRRRQGQRGLPGQPLLGASGDGRSRGHPPAPPGHRQPRGLCPFGRRTGLPPPGPGRCRRHGAHRGPPGGLGGRGARPVLHPASLRPEGQQAPRPGRTVRTGTPGP